MLVHSDLRRKIEHMERKYGEQFKKNDHQFKIVFEAIKKLLQAPEDPKSTIGFHLRK